MALPVIQRPAALTGILSRSRSRIVSHKRVHRGIYGLFRHAGAPSAAAPRPDESHRSNDGHHFRGRRSGPTPAPRNLSLRHGRAAADLPDGIVDPRRCDCSMCRRRGAIAASVPVRACRSCAGRTTCSCTSSTPMWPSTTSATCAASTPITGAAPTRTSTATTWPAWKASTRSRWGHSGQRRDQSPVRPQRLVARAPRRRGDLLPGRHAAAPRPRGSFQPRPAWRCLRRIRDWGGSGRRLGQRWSSSHMAGLRGGRGRSTLDLGGHGRCERKTTTDDGGGGDEPATPYARPTCLCVSAATGATTQHTAVSSASTRSSVASALALTCCSCSALIAGSSAAAWSRDPLAR